MPTLSGFLKKKKTREHESHEPSSPVDRTAPSSALHSRPPAGTTAPDKGGDTVMANNNIPSSAPRSGDIAPISRPPTGDPAAIPNHDGPAVTQEAGQTNGTADATAIVPSNHQATTPRTTKGKYQLPDFSLKRTLGTGSFGRVHLVQSNHNQRFYAIKVLKKQQVVKMKQVEHTNDERKMLCMVKHAFLVTLWGTFQDSYNLYMVMDFVEGGELFSLLRKSQVCDSSG